MRHAVVTLSLLLALPAAAVRPPEGVPTGREPIVVRTFSEGEQAFGETLPPWRAFVAGEGAGWAMRFDGLARVPHALWGPGIDLGAVATPAQAGQAALAFAARHAALLGVAGADLRVASAAVEDAGDTVFVDLDVLHGGLPVWRGGVTLRFRGGKLVQVSSAAWPDAPVTNAQVLDAAAAHAAFQTGGPVTDPSRHTPVHARLVLLPEVRGGKASLRRVWEVRSDTDTTPPGRWVGFVDAATGEVVAFYNTVRFLRGTLSAEHDTRPFDPEAREVSPLRNATVIGAAAETVTSEAGVWSLDSETDPPVVALEGPRVVIADSTFGDVTPEIAAGEVTLTADAWDSPSDDRQAALSAFVFVQQVQDVFQDIAPDNDWVQDAPFTTVNIEQNCNAWFDGTINFLREGNGCRNTGRLADVVQHEWGHGFHYFSIRSGGYDGSLGEGAADVVSMLVNDDHRLAPGFFVGSTAALRDLDNDARYPKDFVANDAAVHSNGLIFGGTMWDLRGLMEAEYGAVEGKRAFAALFARSLRSGPDIPGAYDAFLFADDDDADLSNGTPNQCALVEAFGLHGLGPAAGIGLRPVLETFDSVPAAADAPLDLIVPNPAPDCVDTRPTAAAVRWRTGGTGPYETAALTADGGVRGAIPTASLPLGTFVEYFIEITTAQGSTLLEPTSGEIAPHTFHVGDVLEVRCEDFEDSDGGFTSALLDGEPEPGADDWLWGTPEGIGGDPTQAASGERVWGNDLGGEIDGQRYNGQYQDGKHNRLTSPELDTAHYADVFLRYARWLTVEDGVFDRASILADGKVVWSNWASSEDRGTDHTLDSRWETHVVSLGDLGNDGSVTLAWDLQTDAGLGFGGWTIDDVCVLAPNTPDNRLGIADFRASRRDSEVRLAWTSPRHAPLSRVRVVKKRGDWPEGADDGEIVFDEAVTDLSTAMSATDTDRRGNLYYAVYASDGETWLSWTREGFNADAIDPADTDRAGCRGCSGSQAPGAGWLALLAPLALLRRRRAT